MELQAFIKNTLLDIVGSVQDAQKETPDGTIVPMSGHPKGPAAELGFSDYQVIEFDISVKVEESKDGQLKIGVVSSIVNFGKSKQKSYDTGHTNKLKFKIPIRLPSSMKVI